MGLWMGGALLMAGVAIESLHSADRLLTQPNPLAKEEIRELGADRAVLLLRHQASEQLRSNLENWEIAQAIFGALFFFYLLFGTAENKFALGIVLLMLLAVLVQRFLLTPEAISLGRAMDFAAHAPPGDSSRFNTLRVLYIGVEILKFGLGTALIARLVFQKRAHSARVRDEFELIDRSERRHTDQ
jgi:hypothetical protein